MEEAEMNRSYQQGPNNVCIMPHFYSFMAFIHLCMNNRVLRIVRFQRDWADIFSPGVFYPFNYKVGAAIIGWIRRIFQIQLSTADFNQLERL